MDLLDRLLEHDYWATTTLLDLCRELSDEQLDQSFDIGLGSVRETFGHLIFNIEFWTSVVEGKHDPSLREGPTLSVRSEDAYARFSAFARQIRDDERFDETFVDHFGSNMTFGGAIGHVVLHNAEHRSEVLHMLQRLGVPNLPEIDHGLWDFKSRGLI